MADPQMGEVIRRVGRIVRRHPAEGLTDSQLMERFAVEREESAFTALMHRHGTMVMGVCRRVLHDWHDAEDAFQATFLVLAKKAGAIRKRESIASWLYGVAYRVAQKARGNAARRQFVQAPSVEVQPARSSGESAWHELRPILDAELNRLPEKYRAPLVLCYLEGKTRDEAALQLGWTQGMVKGRLERAREKLRSRLERRGLPLSAALLVAVLSQGAASSATPVVTNTVKAAMLFAAGKSAATVGVSSAVAALTQGALHTMFLAKLTTVCVVVVGMAVTVTGAELISRQMQPSAVVAVSDDEKPKPKTAADDKPAKQEPKKVDQSAARRQSINNLKQIGIAMHNYHDVNGSFPASAIYSKDGKPLLSWRVAVLPYLDYGHLYKEFKLDEPWDSEHNKKLLAKIPVPYKPLGGDPKVPNSTFYQVFAGKGTIFDGKDGLKISKITDGTSNTILVAEAGTPVPWTKPADIPFDADKPLPKLGGMFDEGFHVLSADGAVRRLKDKFDEKLLKLAITCDEGQPADLNKLGK